MDLNEWYVCDMCDKKFTVKAKVRFDTVLEDEFDPIYKTILKKPDILLAEE